MPQRDGRSWNAMIIAYLQGGCPEKAFVGTLSFETSSWAYCEIWVWIDRGGFRFASHLQKAVSIFFAAPVLFLYSLYTNLFQICSSNHTAVEAWKFEFDLVTFSPTPPVFLLNWAIKTLGKCGCLVYVRELFEEMPQRDGRSWNAMITAYLQGGCPEKAL
ncbi:pentatricopeptide repeat-containing protein [Quercus suber]|uniref:Pentatricopeptide repeat-containing protein n=1 Tax=Quercus suber TaxID=58331 RepID=A0AAW0KUX2_QUESU